MNDTENNKVFLKRIWDTLKKQSKKITVLACVTVIGVCVDVYYNIKDHSKTEDVVNEIPSRSSSELDRDSVLTYISMIESTMSNEESWLNVDAEKHPDVKLVRSFKIHTLDFANATKEIYNTPSITQYKDKSFDELLNIEKSWDDKLSHHQKSFDKLSMIINKIDSIGKTDDVNNYITNQILYNDFLEAEKNAGKKSDELQNEAKNILEQAKMFSDETKSEFVEVISLQEQSFKNSYIYQRDKKLLKLLLLLNHNYDIQLKKYKLAEE